MPYNIPPGGVLEARLRATFHEQLVMVTFHYSNDITAVDAGSTLGLVASDFETIVWGAIQPAITDDVLDVKLDLQWIKPNRYVVQTFNMTPDAGASANPAVPTGVAVVCRRRGEEANRHNQGRIFIPGIQRQDIDNSRVTDAWLTANEANLNTAMLATLTDGVYQLFPIIYGANSAGPWPFVLSTSVDPIIRYQRRRELGVGQ